MTVEEKMVVEKLLEQEFTGRDELRIQLEYASVCEMDRNGSLLLHIDRGPDAPVKYRIANEGWYPDLDGVMIHVMLHVSSGRMLKLEIYKDDGSTIERHPSAILLQLLPPRVE